MRECARAEDTTARYGGDEFCIILPNAGADAAEAVCKRVISAFDERRDGLDVSLSIGIVIAGPSSYPEMKPLVALADETMYRSKGEPGHAIHIHHWRPEDNDTEQGNSLTEGDG